MSHHCTHNSSDKANKLTADFLKEPVIPQRPSTSSSQPKSYLSAQYHYSPNNKLDIPLRTENPNKSHQDPDELLLDALDNASQQSSHSSAKRRKTTSYATDLWDSLHAIQASTQQRNQQTRIVKTFV